MVLEKTLENHLDSKEIKSIYPEGNRSWIFIGRADTEGETPKLWLPYAKSRLIGEKTLMLGKIEGKKIREGQRIRRLGGITDSKGMSLSKLQEMMRTGKPGMLQSMGLQKVGHNWATRQQQTLVTWLPGGSVVKNPLAKVGDMRGSSSIPGSGEGHGNTLHHPRLENLHGQRNLEDYSLWGHKKADTTEVT